MRRVHLLNPQYNKNDDRTNGCDVTRPLSGECTRFNESSRHIPCRAVLEEKSLFFTTTKCVLLYLILETG